MLTKEKAIEEYQGKLECHESWDNYPDASNIECVEGGRFHNFVLCGKPVVDPYGVKILAFCTDCKIKAFEWHEIHETPRMKLGHDNGDRSKFKLYMTEDEVKEAEDDKEWYGQT